MKEKGNKELFTKRLLLWNDKENRRQMPWKGEKDPYKIWLSEIILQQTRVEQGLEYYNHFVKIFPKFENLCFRCLCQMLNCWKRFYKMIVVFKPLLHPCLLQYNLTQPYFVRVLLSFPGHVPFVFFIIP